MGDLSMRKPLVVCQYEVRGVRYLDNRYAIWAHVQHRSSGRKSLYGDTPWGTGLPCFTMPKTPKRRS